MKKEQNLFESIINYVPEIDDVQELGNQADHAICSIINILETIEQEYDTEVSNDLVKRLFLSIKNRDPQRFRRGIENISLNENKGKKNG